MILDAATLDQVAAVHRILRRLEGRELPGRAKTELFASVFETNTDVCATAEEAAAALPVLRRAAADAAAAEGLAIAAAGTHPSARPEAQPIVKEERYVSFAGCGGRACRGCTSTWACRTPSRAGAASRRSCRGCRSCSRCRRTRPGSRAR